MKWQTDKGRKKVKEWKKELSIKDLVFRKRPANKLVD